MAKRASKSIGEHLPPAILYREDVEEIYRILSALSQDVCIKADGYIFDNFDELFSHSKNIINELEMKIYNPYVSINLREKEMWLYIDNDTNEQVGAFEKIKSVVIKRRNWRHQILSNFVIALAFSLSSLIFPYLVIITKEVYYAMTGILFGIIGASMGVYSLFIGSKKYSQIVLAYNKDIKLNFLKRNQDAIVVALFVGMILFLLERIFPISS